METGELSEEMQDPTTSINIIYDRCGLCGNIGKALACLYCMQSESKRFLVLTTPTKSLRSLNFQGKYMYLSRDIQDKIQNVHQVLSQHEQLIISSSNSVEELAIQASLKFKIAHCSQNVARLKKLLLARKLEMKQQQNLLSDNKRVIMTLRKKIGKVSQKKSKMKDYIRNRQDSILAIRKKEQILREDLQIHRLQHISMLVQYIFPIEECNKSDLPNMVPQVHDDHGSEVDRETALLQEELEEAQRLHFLHGRWVDQQTGGSSVVQISVGDPCASAPSNGDYSIYETWLDMNQTMLASDPTTVTSSMSSSEDTPTHETPARKAVLGISAALCHTAQLMHIIRKILCLHLPHKLHYRTFCNPTLTSSMFSNYVKLLNSNLVSLCLHQGVDGFSLHPLHTLRNLQILIEKLKKEGVRSVPFIPSIELLTSVEETLGLYDITDDVLEDDSDDNDEWNLSFEADWEAVPTEFTQTLPVTLPTYTSTNVQSSIMTQPAGLVTSALAWATKGWWGQNE